MNVGDSNTEMLILERRGRHLLRRSPPCRPPAVRTPSSSRSATADSWPPRASGPAPGPTSTTPSPSSTSGRASGSSCSSRCPRSPRSSGSTGRSATAHFLGLAQGLALPQFEGHNRNSMVFEWDGEQFVEFQIIPSAVGLQLAPVRDRRPVLRRPRRPRHRQRPVRLGRLALRRPSEPARARAGPSPTSRTTATHYLVVAGLEQPPTVMRWDGERFVAHADARRAGRTRAAGRRAGRAALPDPGQLHPGDARGSRDLADLAGLRVAGRCVR